MAIFIDTNILVYAYSDDAPDKQAIARTLCSQPDRWISTQVMIEFSNIARKKMGMEWQDITLALLEIRKNFKVVISSESTIITASRLADRYQLSWFDSLIVSAAIEANATVLYSEDLNNLQVYENQTRIINPFK
jgi:predicted nucleic acid-binding protein